jgi:hypothetical protein
VIDKDDILEALFEALFESRGAGGPDWRRRLSRESDARFRSDAEASAGAVLVTFWHLPGMPPDSGTPTDWLAKLSERIVEAHCACPAEIAAERFRRRKRHPGHLGREVSYREVLASLRAIPNFGAIGLRRRVTVDTSRDVEIAAVVGAVMAAAE